MSRNRQERIKRLFRFLRHPSFLLLLLDRRNIIRISDKRYLKCVFLDMMGKKLNLKNPKTFNEKLQWLKIHDRKPEYTKMVDKYEVKKYVAEKIGSEYVIPTYGVYDSFEQIDFNKLPKQFVIKCTHDSGSVVICKDKSKLNIDQVREKMQESLKNNYYHIWREWPYKNVKPRIIVEKYLGSGNTMRDYKLFCFSGEPRIMYISDGSHTSKQKIAFFDMDYNQLNIKRSDYCDYSVLPHKPKTFEKMKKYAAILSKGIPHVRVDFYEIDGRLYFGELTFSTGAGFIPFEDEKWDRELGNYIDLRFAKK